MLVVMLLSKSPFVERFEPPGLLRLDGKWPDGVTTQYGKLLVWDATHSIDT